MNKQQLASKIWAAANKMRSKIEANEYKDYILGFIFYKFLSDKEIALLKKIDWEDEDFPGLNEEDTKTVEYCQNKLGYFISYENLYSTWLRTDGDHKFSIGDVHTAMSAFTRLISQNHKKVFGSIFQTLTTGLNKLGTDDGARTKAVLDILGLIQDIPTDSQDYDVLGFIYEYLIGNFAANAGKKAGEFYTPHEVALLMAEIVAWHLKDRNQIEIYDPTSGSGSLLLNIGKAVSKHIEDRNKIKYYAQELKEATYNLTRMNLVMRGIEPGNIIVRNGDTLEDDWPYFEDGDRENTYDLLRVDAVVSNPPYSQQWSPKGKETDPRFSYGIAPKGKADYAFLLHDLYHIKPDGIMTIVLPHGVLFRGGEEETIRKNLIENGNIDAIIGLPSNIFFGTGIPTIVMVLRQKRSGTDTLIIDASKCFIKDGKNNRLQASDIKRIVDAYRSRISIDKFSKVVSLDEIRENGYNLNIPRYVDSSEEAESWDIYATMMGGIPNEEIDSLKKYWDFMPSLRSELFSSDGTPYSALKTEEIKTAIESNKDYVAFKQKFTTAIDSLPVFMLSELIDNPTDVNTAKEEGTLGDKLFSLLEPFSIIDRYEAYQMLDDIWQTISADLEMIQTEGFMDASRKVDPNMIVKKKDGKDVVVQDGWVGHIIPFSITQSTLQELIDARSAIDAKNAILLDIQSRYAEKLDSIEDADYKDMITKEDSEEYDFKVIESKAKEYKKQKTEFADGSFEHIMLDVQALREDEKKTTKEIKRLDDALHSKTKEIIESLDEETIKQLLENKWIVPLCSNLASLPGQVSDTLASRIKSIADKYAVTYNSLFDEEKQATEALSAIIDNLTGSEFDMKGFQDFKNTLLK